MAKDIQEPAARIPVIGDTVRYRLPITGTPVAAQVTGVYNEGDYNASLRLTYQATGSGIYREDFAPFGSNQPGSWNW